MNAKKIMGAVLVALLAAALFVGAGAADAYSDANGKTVFVYQENTPLNGTTWNNGANSVTFDANGVISGKNIVEGAYVHGDYTIYVKYPTAAISAVTNENYAVIGGTLFKQSGTTVTLSAIAPTKVGVGDIFITFPNGTVMRGSEFFGAAATVSGDADPANGTLIIDVAATGVAKLPTGQYKVYAGFAVGDGGLVSYTPDEYRVAKDVYTFTVADETTISISANVDSVIVGSPVTVTITGMPGEQYTIGGDFTLVSNGSVVYDGNLYTMPNNGVAVIYMAAAATGDKEITVSLDGTEKASVTIEVVAGEITAEADAEAYFIGNPVTITGTSTAGNQVSLYIAGTNKEFSSLGTVDVKNGEFKKKFDNGEFDNLDAGTYTIYIASNNDATEVKGLKTYATVALVLKQPFISVTDAPSVAVKGSTYKVTGTAEAANDVYAYIFGTNFFAAANKTGAVAPEYFEEGDFDVTVKDNKFTIEIEIPQATENMSAGQYFMVVQHPMYDKVFNVAPYEVGITMNSSGVATSTSPVVVKVADRQKANAAQALCDNLDSENIDDMYVKLSFIVGAPTSVINPIAEEVVKGEKLTVSGSTNMGKDVVVTVEMLSTAFAAVPKSTVGSASFISLVTKTDENGNWEVTFDTTGLNVDEYTVSAAVEQLGSSATAKVNVIEGAPVTPEQPDTPVTPEQPEQPDEPVAPATPGFGALAGLAGLGAVAVLLLRRE